MIYFYKHKSLNEFSEEELNMLGFEGIVKFAMEHNLDPKLVFDEIKKLEDKIIQLNDKPIDMSSGDNLKLFESAVDKYIDFFNNNANYDKQAYVILGNIASGKSTFANELVSKTHSLIVDPDPFKVGANTKKGYFEGFTSLFKNPSDREKMQDPCAKASKAVLKNAADIGINIIMPKASNGLEKLESQLQVLVDAGYDIHLIMIETPTNVCADRNYYRFLIKEYRYLQEVEKSCGGGYNNILERGRFVPVSIVTNHIGDKTYKTFFDSKTKKNFASYSAFYNDNTITRDTIDIDTMIAPEK